MNLQSVSSGKAHHLVGCSMMVLILLVVGAPWASAELPWWDDGTMAAVGSWQDPSGEGSDLQLEFSPDGSMLLMVGYGSPDEIRVADRDIQLVTTLSPPVSTQR